GSINKINKTFNDLEQKFERTPSEFEVAQALEMSAEDVSEFMKNAGRHVSMDAPLTNEEDTGTMYEVMENEDGQDPDKQLLRESLRKEIERSLATLSSREADIIRLFFGIGMVHPMSLEEIGDRFELTRERVRQIKEKAIRK